MDDQQFRQLLDYFGYSWRGYRKVRKGVKKRIIKHMQDIGSRSMETYLHSLDRDEELRQQCERLMSVSVSHFFRDRLLWEIIESRIVPELIEEKIKKIKFWSAGCASGEEVYSFKILWKSLRARLGLMPELEIWATDINPAYLKRGRDAIYPSSSLREVPEKMREAYFILHDEEGLYRVAPALRQGIVWKVHNLMFDLGESGFGMIFLRNNILTYFKDKLKQPAFQKVMGSLAEGGFLIIGSHEKLPTESKDLLPLDSATYIFKKIGKGS